MRSVLATIGLTTYISSNSTNAVTVNLKTSKSKSKTGSKSVEETDGFAKINAAKLEAKKLETMVTMAATRSEQLARNARANTATNTELFNEMKKLASETAAYKNEALKERDNAATVLSEIKQIPEQAAKDFSAVEIVALQEKLAVVNDELAKLPEEFKPKSSFTPREKKRLDAWDETKKEALWIKNSHEQAGKDSREAAKMTTDKAIAILNDAHEREMNGLPDSDMYLTANAALKEARKESNKATKKFKRAARAGRAIEELDGMITAVGKGDWA